MTVAPSRTAAVTETTTGLHLLAGRRRATCWPPAPAFRPRPPWIGGDLQTLRNSLVRSPDPPAESRARLRVRLPAPQAGALCAVLDEPARARREETILLVHGLGGCEDSAYMRLAAAAFLADGHAVMRLSLRGAGPSAATAPGPYHAGLTGDLAAVLARLELLRPGRPILAMGFSLGGHLLLRLATEAGHAARPDAIVTVSAPLDLAAAQRRFAAPRNNLYQRYLLAGIRRDLRRWGDGPWRGAAKSRLASIRAFDEAVVVPAHGFADVETYYREMSVAPRLPALSLPSLVLHAEDDPWIPASSYRAAAWPERADLCVVLTRSGGHVGFHARGLRVPWYLAAARRFRDRLFGLAPPGGCEQAAEQQQPGPARQ